MAALITGASGFVGQHLTEHLRAFGEEPLALDPSIDISDRRALSEALGRLDDESIDSIYHLAALAHVGDSFESSEDVFRVNATGTLNLVELCRKRFSGAKFLLVSSSEVYGRVSRDRLPVDEQALPAPVSPYAASKAAAEQVALQAFRAYDQKVVVARPFNHIGPGQSESYVVSALAKRVLRAKRESNRSIVVGNLDSRRDFTDVRDVVRAYRLLMDHGKPGQIYNICSGVSISIGELAMEIVRLAEAELVLERDPGLMRDVEVSEIYGDATKAKTALAWKPTIALDRSLRDVLAWWSSHLEHY